MNLIDVQCNKVLPDKASEGLSPAPPERDKLSNYAKFTRTQVSPKSPHEAQNAVNYCLIRFQRASVMLLLGMTNLGASRSVTLRVTTPSPVLPE